MRSTDKPPAHFVVYERLREMVLFGEFAPGEAITIQGLIGRLNAGMTPVREALRRLVAESAIEQNDNRRVYLPILSPSCVEQISLMRNLLETELVKRAVARATSEEIAQLEMIDQHLDQAINRGSLHNYLLNNYNFHKELHRIADAPIIAETADRLWLRFGPSLRVVCGRSGTTNLPDMHAEIITALKDRNVENAVHAISEDIAQGMNQILGAAKANEYRIK